jgi:hypothetical protein
MSALDELTKSIATTATGYAAVINGVLDVATTSSSRKSAAMNGLISSGLPHLAVILMDCGNDNCDCLAKTFEAEVAGGRIVQVKVEVFE